MTFILAELLMDDFNLRIWTLLLSNSLLAEQDDFCISWILYLLSLAELSSGWLLT